MQKSDQPDLPDKGADVPQKRQPVRAKRTSLQTAALPWRVRAGGGVEVLLVTSRDSQQWLPPKGWPMPGKTLAEAAAQEAFEEAGVEGWIDPSPLGSFDHIKNNYMLGPREMTVVVHPLAVTKVLTNWPERFQRQRKWFSLAKAADAVTSDTLRSLILALKRLPRA